MSAELKITHIPQFKPSIFCALYIMFAISRFCWTLCTTDLIPPWSFLNLYLLFRRVKVWVGGGSEDEEGDQQEEERFSAALMDRLPDLLQIGILSLGEGEWQRRERIQGWGRADPLCTSTKAKTLFCSAHISMRISMQAFRIVQFHAKKNISGLRGTTSSACCSNSSWWWGLSPWYTSILFKCQWEIVSD